MATARTRSAVHRARTARRIPRARSGLRFCARLARSGPTFTLCGGHALARLCTHRPPLGWNANGAPAFAPLVSQAVEDRDRFVELGFVRPEIR
jgi:hypothetical protein